MSTVKELREECKKEGIPCPPRLKKNEIIALLEKNRKEKEERAEQERLEREAEQERLEREAERERAEREAEEEWETEERGAEDDETTIPISNLLEKEEEEAVSLEEFGSNVYKKITDWIKEHKIFPMKTRLPATYYEETRTIVFGEYQEYDAYGDTMIVRYVLPSSILIDIFFMDAFHRDEDATYSLYDFQRHIPDLQRSITQGFSTRVEIVDKKVDIGGEWQLSFSKLEMYATDEEKSIHQNKDEFLTFSDRTPIVPHILLLFTEF